MASMALNSLSEQTQPYNVFLRRHRVSALRRTNNYALIGFTLGLLLITEDHNAALAMVVVTVFVLDSH